MKDKRLYDSVRWRRARAAYLRDHPLCALCARAGRDEEATIVDHKIEHKGDYDTFWNDSNWQALCASCHSGIKRITDKHGYSQATDLDGFPMDFGHPWNK